MAVTSDTFHCHYSKCTLLMSIGTTPADLTELQAENILSCNSPSMTIHSQWSTALFDTKPWKVRITVNKICSFITGLSYRHAVLSWSVVNMGYGLHVQSSLDSKCPVFFYKPWKLCRYILDIDHAYNLIHGYLLTLTRLWVCFALTFHFQWITRHR